jgi:mRNA interferase MazF
VSTDETSEVRRGYLYWVDWSPGRGSEQAGLRPALVIQTDAANRAASYPNTIVLAVSSAGRDVYTHVAIEPCPSNGLTRRSYVKCEQVMTISKSRLQGRLGSLTAGEMNRVTEALKQALDMP